MKEGHEMKVEYIDHMGDDISVVNSARVSFNKTSEGVGVDEIVDHEDENGLCTLSAFVPNLKEADKKLIAFLAKHNHFTPFTHATVTMRETVPIFVARQRFKHVIGFTYNEVSRRYVSDSPDFHVPSNWRYRPDNVKQGSSDTEFVQNFADDSCSTIWNIKSSDSIHDNYMTYIIKAKQLYLEMLASGVCPEQARMILPQSMNTEYYVTGSLMAWARAYNLRIQPTAQLEIRELAMQWDKVMGALYPVSWKALTTQQDK
jgi:thymidylate synthase (FAD)